MSVTSSSEELLELYGAAIVSLAQHLFAKGSGGIERTELVSYGVEGMLQAARRYDPDSGVQFWTFAYTRVHGAMLDAIREAMPLPRRRHRQLESARAACHAAALGTPEHAAASRRLAEETEAVALLSPSSLAITLGEALGVDEDVDPDDDDPAVRVFRVDSAGAEERLERAELATALVAAMRQLTVQERMILRGLYFEDRGLFELGADLGLSKSWASRIHTRALGRLQKLLAKGWGHDAVDAPARPARGNGIPAELTAHRACPCPEPDGPSA